MSNLYFATVVISAVLPGSLLADAPYLAFCQSKIRRYCLEVVLDVSAVTIVLWMGTIAELSPIPFAACLSAVICSTKGMCVALTCVSGKDVRQPTTLLGEVRLCSTFLLGGVLFSLEVLSPFLLLAYVQ
jgi:hypothetical protein